MHGQQSLRSSLQLLSVMKNKLKTGMRNETPGFVGPWIRVGTPHSEITNPPMKRGTGRRCTGLITPYHQTFKPLISRSICSRTSSSIICPPVRRRRGSGAAREPDRMNSFFCTCMTQCLSIHHPVHLWSLPLQMWLPSSPADGALDVWGVLFIYVCVCVFVFLFFNLPSNREIKYKEVLQSLTWINFCSMRTCFSFYVDAFLAFCYRANMCFVSDCMHFDS